jgi:hypothetical protein
MLNRAYALAGTRCSSCRLSTSPRKIHTRTPMIPCVVFASAKP